MAYSALDGIMTARTSVMTLWNSPMNQANLPAIPENKPNGGFAGIRLRDANTLYDTGLNGLGSWDTTIASLGGSAVGVALVIAFFMIGNTFFGADAKQRRGRNRLSKLEARYKSDVISTKQKYGLGE